MIIVLTGGIGSGKSQVCRILSERFGFHVYEADSRVKDLYNTHPTLLQRIESELCAELRDDQGRFVPSLLAGIIFHDKDALNKVESLVFPALIDDFNDWRARTDDGTPVVFESATVLEKSRFDDFGDITVLVDAPYEIRLSRAAERDGDIEAVKARMAHQKLMNILSEGAADVRIDHVIHNHGSIEELEAEISGFVEKIHNNINVTHEQHNS